MDEKLSLWERFQASPRSQLTPSPNRHESGRVHDLGDVSSPNQQLAAEKLLISTL